MKKVLTFVFALVTSVLLNSKVFAIWPDFTPVIPVAPQFCAQCIAADIPLVLGYIEQAKAMKDKYMSYLNTSFWKQKFSAYISKLGGAAFGALLKKAGQREKFLSYARSIKDSKVANLSNETDVQEVYIKLFFQYPSDKPSVMAEYEDMGKQFQMDSAIEAVVATKGMKTELAKMKEDLEKIEKCLMQNEGCSEMGMQDCSSQSGGGEGGGGGGEDDKEDNSCLWNNANTAIILYDKIMRYNENLIYMMSQYKAVQGIGGLAKIRPYSKSKKGKKKKKLLGQVNVLPEQKVYAEISSSVAFADQTTDDDSDFSDYIQDLVERDGVMLGNFDASTPDTGMTSGLDGKEDDIEGMNALTEVQSDVDSAKSMHNMRQNLPEYRRVFESYHNMEARYNKALRNFWQSSMCAMNMLSSRYGDSVKAWFGKNCTIKNDNFGRIYCHYEHEGAEPEDEGGTTSYNAPCPDNPAETCYVATFDNQGARRGISGYLLDLYDAAKEQDATEDVESSIVVSNDTTDDNSYVTKIDVDLQEGDTNKNKGTSKDTSLYVTEKDGSEGGYGSGDGGGGLVSLNSMKNQTNGKTDADTDASKLKDPSLEDAINAETRKEELLPWTIGHEVMAAVDKDLRTGAGKFSTVTSRFPLWNDQIFFYKQYITGKYENIIKYIDEEPFAKETLDLAEIINKVKEYEPVILPDGIIVKTVEQVRAGYADGIKEARKYFNNLADRSDGIDALLQEQDSVLDGKIAAQRAKIEGLYKQKDQLNKQLKDVNEKLSELRDEHNRANDDITSSDVTSERAGEGNDYSEKLYAGRELSQKSPQDKSFSATQSSNAVVKAAAEKNQRRIQSSIRSYENQAKAIKNSLSRLKETIKTARTNYVKEYSDADIKQKKKLNTKMESLTEKSSQAIEKMKSFASDNPAIELAYKAVKCVRGYATSQVTSAEHSILGLEGTRSLYYAENGSIVQGIHKDMIKKITDIKAENLGSDCNVMAQFSEALSALKIEDPMQPVYDIFKNLCKDGFCLKVDSDYYVSFLGRKRDFMAPKAAVDFASAPLREVFHFDVTDYGKIDQAVVDSDNPYSNKSVTITAQSFLESGLDIPEIWRYILARRSYVERSIDLDQVFGDSDKYPVENALNREFLRGGVYPCAIGQKIVDVLKGSRSSTYQILSSVPSGNFGHIGACQEVTKVGGKIVDLKTMAAPTYDRESAQDQVFADGPTSELGTVLGYTSDTIPGFEILPSFLKFPFFKLNKKLTFNGALQNAVQIINKNEDLGDNPRNDALFYMSQRALLDRNQFGDYLNQYEILSSIQKSMEELEEQMQEVRDGILFAIEDTDFTLREDFDLTNSNDYDDVRKILYDQKKIYMNSAQNNLNKIHSTTTNLDTKIARVKHIIEVLKKDDQTVIAVSGDEDLDEMDEAIKNRKADSSVANEYASAEKESEQNQKELMPPYCATY